MKHIPEVNATTVKGLVITPETAPRKDVRTREEDTIVEEDLEAAREAIDIGEDILIPEVRGREVIEEGEGIDDIEVEVEAEAVEDEEVRVIREVVDIEEEIKKEIEIEIVEEVEINIKIRAEVIVEIIIRKEAKNREVVTVNKIGKTIKKRIKITKMEMIMLISMII